MASMMTKLNATASKILDQLVAGLDDRAGKSSRTIGGPRGQAIMPVSIERISRHQYSVAHYYEQNGDLMADPEMVFWKHPERGEYFPVHFQQDNLGVYRKCLWFDKGEDQLPTRFAGKEMRDQASFANQWMGNIKEQQAGWFKGEVPENGKVKLVTERVVVESVDIPVEGEGR